MSWSKWIVAGLIILTLTQCGLYSFNGVSIPADVQTVSVGYIENHASLVAPELSPTLTDKLRQKFLTQTNLQLIDASGDFDITAEVTGYSVNIVGAQDNSSAAVNRLQISVKAKMKCPKSPKLEFDQTFTQFEDFDANKSLTDVESDLIQSISVNIVQEIFNKATLNW